MSLESASYATQLNTSNPLTSDPRSEGDDHIRNLKTVIQNERSAANAQWIYTGHSVTRRSTTAFSIDTTNYTSVYSEGRRIKATGTSTGTVYGTVVSSTYSSATSVNLSLDSGTLANETLAIFIGVMTNDNDAIPRGKIAIGGSTGGTGSAGTGNQYISMTVNGVTYKVLHDGTV